MAQEAGGPPAAGDEGQEVVRPTQERGPALPGALDQPGKENREAGGRVDQARVLDGAETGIAFRQLAISYLL